MIPWLTCAPLVPLAGLAIAWLLPSMGWIRRLAAGCGGLSLLVAVKIAADVVANGPVAGGYGLLYADGLTSLFLVTTSFAGAAALLHAAGEADRAPDRRDLALSFAVLFAVEIALVADSLPLVWLGIEGAALGAGFLFSSTATGAGGRGRWTRLAISSAAAALGLLGVALLHAALAPTRQFLGIRWSLAGDDAPQILAASLAAASALLLASLGARLALFGGTRFHAIDTSRLVPVVYTGVLLPATFYVLLRVHALSLAVLGAGRSGHSLALLGGLALAGAALAGARRTPMAAVSVGGLAHLGITSLGLGIAGLAAAPVALLHMVHVAIAQTLLWLSFDRPGATTPAGRLGRTVALLALAGVPISGVFLSGSLLLGSLFAAARTSLAVAVLVGAAVVSTALLATLAQEWAGSSQPARTESRLANVLLLVLAFTVVGLGFSVSRPLQTLAQAAGAALSLGRLP